MRIALIATSPETVKLFLVGFANFLAARGHRVTLISGGKVSDFAKFETARVRVGIVPMERNPRPGRDLRSLWLMWKFLRANRQDVVFYATPKASLLASCSSFILRIPVRVYALWGLRFETSNRINRRLLKFIERTVGLLSTSVLANSRSLMEAALRYSTVTGDKIHVIGQGSSHGVDALKFSKTEEFDPVDPETSTFLRANEGLTLGFIGRLHPDKGIDILLDALLEAAAQQIPVKLLLVGAFEGFQLDPKWSSLTCHFVGSVEDVRPYLNELDVLVLMSRREGFPNVVLEAASMEVPAIVSNATGCVDSVEHGVTGLVIPLWDVTALSEAIVELAADSPKRRRLGRNARERILKYFVQEDVWFQTEKYIVDKFQEAGAQTKAQPVEP